MIDIEQIKLDNDILEHAQKFTALSKVAVNEYAGACPVCGGKDRFRVNTEKQTYFCRKCHNEVWHDVIHLYQWFHKLNWKEAVKRLSGIDLNTLTAEERAELAARKAERDAERAKVARMEAEQARDEATKLLEELRQRSLIEEYHDTLVNNSDISGLIAWAEAGISDPVWLDYYKLGYAPEFHSGKSITFPLLQPEYINIKHRLLQPQKGRYRMELSGLGPLMTNLYWTTPELGVTNTIWIVNGEKKAMVTNMHLNTYDQVISAPDKLKPEHISVIGGAENYIYIPDPDVSKQQVWDNIKLLGKDRSRLIQLPDKIDDLLNRGEIDGHGGLMALANTAQRFKGV